MVEWESGCPLGPKLCMASRVFKRDVLRILMSDLDDGQEKHTLGIKERSCVNAMFIIIMSAEICWRIGFVM